MTTQREISILGNTFPLGRGVLGGIMDDAEKGLSLHIRPVRTDEKVLSLFTRLAKVLPMRMSETHVEQLRIQYPQPPAIDDPATYEFETE